MNGIHPIQPAAMDIKQIKAKYENWVCILGNIDFDYSLIIGTSDEVDKEIKKRIVSTKPGGSYIVTSASSLTDYCRAENTWVTNNAINNYGKYPI